MSCNLCKLRTWVLLDLKADKLSRYLKCASLCFVFGDQLQSEVILLLSIERFNIVDISSAERGELCLSHVGKKLVRSIHWFIGRSAIVSAAVQSARHFYWRRWMDSEALVAWGESEFSSADSSALFPFHWIIFIAEFKFNWITLNLSSQFHFSGNQSIAFNLLYILLFYLNLIGSLIRKEIHENWLRDWKPICIFSTLRSNASSDRIELKRNFVER